MSENTQNNTPKKEQYSLNDDRRVAIGNNKAQFIVAGHTHILFGHLGVGVELLVLAVRADHV